MPFQQLNQHELQQYFARIRCNAVEAADLESLQLVHRRHALSIPFENLNPLLGLPVVLTREALVQKLVLQQRGGYCFEHNLLLGHVLATLGFTVHGLAARVSWMLPPDVIMPRTHMVLLILLNGTRYIADVGFGGLTLTSPLLLDTAAPQATSHERFCLTESRLTEGSGDYTLSALIGGAWQDMYRFDLSRQHHPDYEMANWFVAAHPQSRFVNNLIAARVDEDGRHALQNQHYTRHYLDRPAEKTELRSPAAVKAILQERFLIDTAGLPGLDERLGRLFSATSLT